jgi:heme-degrading monooxygenase HmoA
MGLKPTDPSPSSWQADRTSRRKLAKVVGLGVAATMIDKSMVSSLYAANNGVTDIAANPVQLHITIEVKPGKGPELEKIFQNAYIPAIKVQDGFLWTRLLRKYDSNSNYEIDISFKSEKQRAAWAQSKEHQSAWPRVEEVSAKISWQGFDQLT